MLKPIWCKRCRRHSWTRQELLTAWINSVELTCLEPSCQSTIPPQDIQEVLIKAGVIDLDEDDEIEDL